MIFLDYHISSAKPKEKQLFSLLRSKIKKNRLVALKLFHEHYSEELQTVEELTIWLSGSIENYKLVDIRKLLVQANAKVVTRQTKKTDLLVVSSKTKIEKFPENIKVVSGIAFLKILTQLEEEMENQKGNDNIDSKIIELLLHKELENVEKGLDLLEEGGTSLKVMPLLLALFKVHHEKSIRTRAKVLLEKESTKTVKDALTFCEGRNFLNAKYTVGMDELAKIKGFAIDLFLYYLVLEQKNHLGKEYLASLDSDWTQKLLEETDLLNKESLELYGKAGERFIYAKNIKHFTVHANSAVLWKMNWLKSLIIIDLKEKVILPKSIDLSALEILVLEIKELMLRGNLEIKDLTLRKCKILEISDDFRLLMIESITLDSCGFNMKVFMNFLEKVELPMLKKITIRNFTAYKMPKDFEKYVEKNLPEIEFSFK